MDEEAPLVQRGKAKGEASQFVAIEGADQDRPGFLVCDQESHRGKIALRQAPHLFFDGLDLAQVFYAFQATDDDLGYRLGLGHSAPWTSG
ncbi:MAG: hypothetical protein DMG70_25350 [Acidobacteria bacterium]|nr:MAG: hypothetical protein DMG70_25350 [Acidobacteriota bacterium]